MEQENKFQRKSLFQFKTRKSGETEEQKTRERIRIICN